MKSPLLLLDLKILYFLYLVDRHAGASEEEKQEQERKFKEVGEAYAVLSDTKKRSRYDNGHDLDNLVSSSNNSSNHGFSDHHMDASQIFKAFFGNSAAGMHAHSYHHHSGFGAGGPGAAGQMPGNFFQFG
jgi:DnaJ-class molecular chaperone